MTAPAYTEDLAAVQCGNPKCMDPDCSSILVLMPVCHPQAGIYAEYVKADGTLRTYCGHCRRPVITFQIANMPAKQKQ